MVAEDTQQVPVGYCGIYLSLDEGEITNVAVRPECRKQGIADAILDTVFMEAQKRGAEKIYLEVRQSNIPAQQLYGETWICVLWASQEFLSKTDRACHCHVL